MGIVVDSVSEVLNILHNEIEPPPQYGSKVDEEYLIGMGKVKGKVVMLLNIEKIINSEELVNLLNDMKGNAVNV